MPLAQGRMNGNFEHINRRRHTLIRRFLDQKNSQFTSKAPQISAVILRNSEQRCIVLTLVSLELDARWKLVRESEPGNYLQSGVSVVDDRKSVSRPLIFFQVNLPEEQKIDIPESSSLQKSSSTCSSSGTHVMGRPRNRKKRSKSFNDPFISSPPRCSEVDSSGSLCDSLGTVGSDVLASDTVEKPQKRSSRKKGKKKRKQCKRSMRKNVSTGLEGQCEETTRVSSIVANSVPSAPASLSGHISGHNVSENAIFPSLSAEDTNREKDGSETNNEYIDSSATVMSCRSYSDELDDSETLASSVPQLLVCDKSSNLNCKSSATCRRERTSSFVDTISENTYPERTNDGNDSTFSNSYSTMDQNSVDPPLGSFQDCWNNDISGGCSNYVETSLTTKDKCELCTSKVVDSESMHCDTSSYSSTVGPFVMDKGIINDCLPCDPHCSEDVLRQGNTERAECNSHASSSNVLHPVISGKRGRTSRKKTSRTGKDNNHPVWKKIQKMDTEHCINEKKDVYQQVDFPAKYCDTRSILDTSDCLKKNQKGKSGRYPCSYESINQTSKPFSSKITSTAADSKETNGERKPSAALKPMNYYSRKGFPNGNAALSRPSKSHAQQKDRLRILPEVNEGKFDSRSGYSSVCSNDCQLLMVKSTEKVDFCHSEHQQQVRNYSDEGSSSENTCSTSGEMTSAVKRSQIGQSFSAFDSLGHTPMELHFNVKEHNNLCQDLSLMETDSKCENMQAECYRADYNDPDNKFGSLLQKWVPVGRKETVVSCASLTDNMEASLIDESVPDKLDTKNAEEEAKTTVHSFVPLTIGESQCSTCTTAELSCLSSETDKLACDLRHDPYAPREFVGLRESSLHLSNKVQYQGFPPSESDARKIIHAINISYNSQATAEAVQQASETPLAEVERFIHSTSPAISGFPEYLGNIHNITLGSLWQWYEEPGCYGLEVKAEENCSSKRSHDGCLEFKAYFVPYLSAVQLFGRPGTNNTSCEADKGTKTPSELESLSLSSKLLPQPCMEEDACLLGSSSSVKDKLRNHLVRIGKSDDEELIFEYFEHAQPPQRRPLFEKIKELVNGDITSNSQIYGDPSKLECMNLHDLHPASWYSVAWYPIYRIPEGNFRTAFLTYHSLGCFLHQSASPNTTGDVSHIVSPAVGLQSYNAKKECWFEPRVSNFKDAHAEVLRSKTSTLLEERLRTLEHTASVMATATVSKDNQRYINNHPDYNHFLSRW